MATSIQFGDKIFTPRFNQLPPTEVRRIERPDVRALEILIANFETHFSHIHFFNPSTYETMKEVHLNVKILRDYQAGIKNGERVVQYSQNKYDKRGRYYADKGLGLICLPNCVRGTLCKGRFIDIDISNAHPVIALQLAQMVGIHCPKLAKYIERRDEYIQTIKDLTGLDRREAKSMVISWLYGSKCLDSRLNGSSKLVSLQKELSEIVLKLSQVSDIYIKLAKASLRRKDCNEKHNIEGKACSRLLQEIENEILMTMVYHLKTKGIEVAVFGYDGFMVETESLNGVNVPALLSELEAVVAEKVMGLKISLCVKDFDETLDLTGLDAPKSVSYETIKADFEKKVCKVNNPLLFGIYEPVGHHTLPVWTFVQRETLINRFEDLTYPKLVQKGKYSVVEDVSFVKDWLVDSTKRVYDSYTFDPSRECPENVLNTFSGFAIERIPYTINEEARELLALFKKHILEVVALNNQDHFAWFWEWLSSVIFQPKKRVGVMPVLRGQMGCGKSLIWSIIGKMLGSEYYYETSAPENDLFKNFNAVLSQKVFVNIEEGGEGLYNNLERMKQLLTGSTLSIERKGREALEVANCLAFVINTNLNNPVKVEEDNRRFAVFGCSNKYIGRTDYFARLGSILTNPNALGAIFEDLREVSIRDSFIPLPDTEEMRSLIRLNLPSPLRFIEDKFHQWTAGNIWKPNRLQNNELTITVSISDLIDDYKDWCNETHYTAVKRDALAECLKKEPISARETNPRNIRSLSFKRDTLGLWLSNQGRLIDENGRPVRYVAGG